MLTPNTIAHIKELMTEASVFDEDIEESFILGGGPGGQKTNKTSNVVRLKHEPSGLQIRFGETAKQQEIEKKHRQKRGRSRRQKQKMLDDKHAHSEKKAARKPVDW